MAASTWIWREREDNIRFAIFVNMRKECVAEEFRKALCSSNQKDCQKSIRTPGAHSFARLTQPSLNHSFEQVDRDKREEGSCGGFGEA